MQAVESLDKRLPSWETTPFLEDHVLSMSQTLLLIFFHVNENPSPLHGGDRNPRKWRRGSLYLTLQTYTHTYTYTYAHATLHCTAPHYITLHYTTLQTLHASDISFTVSSHWCSDISSVLLALVAACTLLCYTVVTTNTTYPYFL